MPVSFQPNIPPEVLAAARARGMQLGQPQGPFTSIANMPGFDPGSGRMVQRRDGSSAWQSDTPPPGGWTVQQALPAAPGGNLPGMAQLKPSPGPVMAPGDAPGMNGMPGGLPGLSPVPGAMPVGLQKPVPGGIAAGPPPMGGPQGPTPRPMPRPGMPPTAPQAGAPVPRPGFTPGPGGGYGTPQSPGAPGPSFAPPPGLREAAERLGLLQGGEGPTRRGGGVAPGPGSGGGFQGRPVMPGGNPGGETFGGFGGGTASGGGGGRVQQGGAGPRLQQLMQSGSVRPEVANRAMAKRRIMRRKPIEK